MNDALTGGGGGQTPVHPDDLEGLRLRWIRTQGALDNAESQNLGAGRAWALQTSAPRPLDQLLDDRWLYRLHTRCFGDVWAWAGTPRTRMTSIGVAPVEVVRATRDAMLDAQAQLEGDDTRPGRIVAWLHHRLAAVHPFANGNGRTLRLHAELLARSLGLPVPTWGAARPDARASYLAALRAADGADYGPLEQFIWS